MVMVEAFRDPIFLISITNRAVRRKVVSPISEEYPRMNDPMIRHICKKAKFSLAESVLLLAPTATQRKRNFVIEKKALIQSFNESHTRNPR